MAVASGRGKKGVEMGMGWEFLGWWQVWVWVLILAVLVVIVVAPSWGPSADSCCCQRVPQEERPALVPVGVTPASLALTRDGRRAYVANSNNYGLTGGHTVSVVDLRRGIVEMTISDPSFDEPWRIGLYRGSAYVANSAGSTVTVIDTRTNHVTGVIDGFDGPSGFAVAPKLGRAYVNNYGASAGVGSGNGTTVTVVDLASGTIIGSPIVVALAPASVAVSPDETLLYVACYVDGNPGTGLLQAVSTQTDAVVATASGFSGPFGLALTPDGRQAVVTNFGSNNFTPIGTSAAIVDLRRMQIVANVSVGMQPAGVAIDRRGRRAYVTNYDVLYAGPGYTNLTPGQGTVSIIDLKTRQLVGPTIAAGQGPNAIAISPDGRRAFVTNYLSNSLSILRI